MTSITLKKQDSPYKESTQDFFNHFLFTFFLILMGTDVFNVLDSNSLIFNYYLKVFIVKIVQKNGHYTNANAII